MCIICNVLLLCFSNSLGVARNSFQMTHLACYGDENYLWDCAFDNITDYHCDYYNQIAVYCGMYKSN